MKIAIHKSDSGFSVRWLAYCKENKVPHKIVNCYDTDIIEQLKDCDGLMWHWSHRDYRAQNFARQLIISVEKMGIKVFPNSGTSWHFDDKVGQKYLLEAIAAPLVASYSFYDEIDALNWLDKTDFPKVFKLRGGASALNVNLVKNREEGIKLVKRAFGKGFPLVDKKAGIKQRFYVLKRDKSFKSLVFVLKGFGRLLFPKTGLDLLPVQKGYVYFQEFIPNNSFDDRIIVIGDRAIGLKRYVRKGDFRASGSGVFSYEPKSFNLKSVEIAFDVANKINSQSLAFDFVYDTNNEPLIVEISYCYSTGSAYDNCPGYWDKDLNWHEASVNPQYWIIEDFIKEINA